jgi:hypothetical protein
MAKNLKKGQRIGRTPKTGTELAISPRRVIVFGSGSLSNAARAIGSRRAIARVGHPPNCLN